MNRIGLLVPVIGLAAVLAACGGGDSRETRDPADDPSAVATEVPAPVEQSPLVEGPDSPQEPAPSGPAAQEPEPADEPPPALNPEVVGPWRAYSARIFYDEGGGGTVDTTITRELELAADGTWYFGSSSGSYAISDISADDWSRWGVDPYGPTRKITLFGWNGDAADGPVEESGYGVDFLWVIYYEGPPVVGAPGTVWMKFGHA